MANNFNPGFDREKAAFIALANSTHAQPVSRIPGGYAMTSTGKVVLQDDWDEIEGNM